LDTLDVVSSLENISLNYYGINIQEYDSNEKSLKEYYNIDNLKYKEIRNIIYNDFEKFYKYILDKYENNTNLKEEIEKVLEYLKIDFECDIDYLKLIEDIKYNPLFTQISISEDYIYFSYYEKLPILCNYQSIEDLIEKKTTVIVNRNYKEMYFIKSELNYFSGNKKRKNIIKYEVVGKKIEEKHFSINNITSIEIDDYQEISKVKTILDNK